jgi:hypothetical protein
VKFLIDANLPPRSCVVAEIGSSPRPPLFDLDLWHRIIITP